MTTATTPDDPALVDAGTMLTALAGAAHDTARDKGWFDDPTVTFGDRIALIHSEVSEALEEFRSGHAPDLTYYSWKVGSQMLTSTEQNDTKSLKPEGVPAELADIIIRVLDLSAFEGIDIGAAVAEKMAFNRTRSHRHGGKLL